MIKEGRRPRQKLEGMRFGKWTVQEYLGFAKYTCLCDCGTRKAVLAKSLTTGQSRSCKCASVELRKEFAAREREAKRVYIPATIYEADYVD